MSNEIFKELKIIRIINQPPIICFIEKEDLYNLYVRMPLSIVPFPNNDNSNKQPYVLSPFHLFSDLADLVKINKTTITASFNPNISLVKAFHDTAKAILENEEEINERINTINLFSKQPQKKDNPKPTIFWSNPNEPIKKDSEVIRNFELLNFDDDDDNKLN